jgi:hypothetical protein
MDAICRARRSHDVLHRRRCTGRTRSHRLRPHAARPHAPGRVDCTCRQHWRLGPSPGHHPRTTCPTRGSGSTAAELRASRLHTRGAAGERRGSTGRDGTASGSSPSRASTAAEPARRHGAPTGGAASSCRRTSLCWPRVLAHRQPTSGLAARHRSRGRWRHATRTATHALIRNALPRSGSAIERDSETLVLVLVLVLVRACARARARSCSCSCSCSSND